jgi:hypothetical protein
MSAIGTLHDALLSANVDPEKAANFGEERISSRSAL